MHFDLESGGPDGAIAVSVCIVGSGPAGLALERRLEKLGIDAAVLESGSLRAVSPEFRADVCYDRREYRGATLGRASGFGGTSAIWGGQLLPIAEADLGARAALGVPPWPISYEDLTCRFDAVERWLGVNNLPYGPDAAQRLGLPSAGLRLGIFGARLSKWIPFGGRNLGRADFNRLRDSKRTQVWTHACAVEWHSDDGQSITRMCAYSASGHVLEVRPKYVVICAGALESTRSVLEIQDQTGLLPAPACRHLGRYLHDHLSVRVARVRVIDPKRFNVLFAPVFHGSTMHSHKIELSGEAAWSLGVPSLYLHFVGEVAEDSGFGVVRDAFRAMQRADAGAILAAVRKLPFALPGVMALAFWRFVRERLAFPSDAQVFLHVDMEQPALASNRVYLGNTRTDGKRRDLHIDWDLRFDAGKVVGVLKAHIEALWADNGLSEVAELSFFDLEGPSDAWLNNLYDIYHPAGTTRMAESPEVGVVDPDLLLFGTRNTFVLSSSSFPSMGSANPTFTLLALAVRLAQQLQKLLKQEDI